MNRSKEHVLNWEYNHCRDTDNSQACGKRFIRKLQAIQSLGESTAGGLCIGERELKVRLGILALV